MSEAEPIARPFPAPPVPVREVLLRLLLTEREVSDATGIVEDGVGLPRPWDPASCPADLRAAVWDWCGAVAAWLNREYAWRPAQLIPSCWPRHGHIAHELALLAVLRWRAQRAAGPEALEEWHRYAFPLFCERMSDRLGESSCRTGTHQDWPAQSRYAAFTAPGAEQARRLAFAADRGCR